MYATNDRDQFAPTRPPGRMRAVALAVLVHAALIGALTWGVHWKTSADQPSVDAELWSQLPQQAAPAAVAPPPPPEPTPAPTPAPPPPAPPPPPPQAAPQQREADIAIEREKKRLEQEKKERQLQAERDQRERERREQAEQERKERLQKEKDQREKEQREKDRREQQEKQQAEKEKQEQQQKKLAEEKRKAEAADAKRMEAQRQENLRRMQGLAGATGGETSTGTAQRSSGPSGSYGGKVAAKVRPNIVYPDAISDNLRTEVEVRAAPDGTIVGTRITRSSGNKAWDDAVVRALEKTETLPRDVDGRVPSSLVIGFRPRD
ncbi:cell division and transport-associated protein TolA [Paracidovorax anthurii]|uniref:Cell division and transport-associated protein TolA n=2 Tax=Paracidovorax anthurii TaxID=78229 RepID=A0A328ZIS7_9BURK|nr:cell envelope integrity protein TolA [Paracidovorax anthurii]RAR86128.1 cell division and transport-associated protein TolA [Paracidovorax anthurii]